MEEHLWASSPFRRPSERASHPFPYYLFDQMLDDTFYLELERDFPPVPLAVRNRGNAKGNKSIRRTDAEYAALLSRSPAWRKLHDFVHSQQMIDLGMQLFGRDLDRNPHCLVDSKKAVFVDHIETLDTRDPASGNYTGGGLCMTPFYRRHRERTGDPNQMYTTMDFFHGPGVMTMEDTYKGQEPYFFAPHRDGACRVFSLLLYFTSTSERMGGNFLIHEGDGGVRVNRSISIGKNSGLAHLAPLETAWHSVLPYLGKNQYRKLVQIQATSNWAVCRDGIETAGCVGGTAQV